MSSPHDGIPFSLQHVQTGQYLGVQDNASYAGAGAVLTAATHDTAPQWSLRSEQKGKYLLNASAPSMCLNVAYESKAAGAKLQQWDCNGGQSELWKLMPAYGGNVVVVNMNSDLAVAVETADAETAIVQLRRDDERAQWKVIMPDTTPKAQTMFAAPTLADEMIYNIYIPIYSPLGDLYSVTKDLPRIAGLGFSTILLMPIHPMGVPVGKRPAMGSPYAVSDFYAMEPALGQFNDLTVLVSKAHTLGLKVILDVVLNHTAWNHSFVTQRPDWYVHSDRNKKAPNTITQAFWFEDVAQLDWKSGTAVMQYMAEMLVWWLRSFQLDGFRFDTPDNPYGKDRMVPASAWKFIGDAIKGVNPDAILLGECCNPELSLKPFNLDYTNYTLQSAVASACIYQNASDLQLVCRKLKKDHPKGMIHTCIMQTWDMDLDLRMYGGPDGTMAAAVLNFTIEGVPMILAGEEVCNDRGGINTHEPVNWNGPLASRFSSFYHGLGMLRRDNVALRRGDTTWLRAVGAGPGLIAFLRTGEGRKTHHAGVTTQTFIAINLSSTPTQGESLAGLKSEKWHEVTPPGALHCVPHPSPPKIDLSGWDFCIFVRPFP